MTTTNLPIHRRQFLTSTSIATAAAAFGIIGCKKTVRTPKRSSGIFVGEGEFKYEVINDWVTLPDRYSWQITHNVAVDKDGFL